MEDPDHRPKALREFRWRRHHARQQDAEDVDGGQAKEGLDAKRLEDLRPVVIQLVGKGQNALKHPHHGDSKSLHGTRLQVLSQFIGNHNEGVEQIPEEKEKALTANHAVDRDEHGNARNDGKNVHEIEI